jgi:hypothetical protein
MAETKTQHSKAAKATVAQGRVAAHKPKTAVDRTTERSGELAVLPEDVVNPSEGWAVADGAVVASRVVVLQPVWQGLAAGV